ncbi:glycosyltransferase [Enterococcus faecium]|nr:glycosyltransferase [Enterococcus faecium]
MFQGHPYEIIHNGIDLSLYETDEQTREMKREELGISLNDFVVGNIGRLEKQKNQAYLIDVFSELIQKRPDAKLLIVGAGSLQHNLEKKIDDMGLSKMYFY